MLVLNMTNRMKMQTSRTITVTCVEQSIISFPLRTITRKRNINLNMTKGWKRNSLAHIKTNYHCI